MARSEACQLYIEQEIQEGLAQGKTPYSIGKELSAWVEKLFEANIPATTIEKRAERIKNPTNVGNSATPQTHSEIQKNLGGRPQKYTAPPKPFSNAMHTATFVISYLQGILPDDPNRIKALKAVSKWVQDQLNLERVRGK